MQEKIDLIGNISTVMSLLSFCVLFCGCSGTIGSKNMDNIDNINEEFHPLTLKRSVIPAYTPTAQ